MNLTADCTIIGNGASRKKYDLDDIRHATFGCNQIYKEYMPTFLVAKDKRVLEQMSRDGVKQVYVPFLSHRAHRGESTITIPDMIDIRFPYIRMNSWLTGEIAIVLAAQMGFENIQLIGFDGGPDSIYRQRTDTNVSLEHNQVPEWRYGHTFQKILEYYPEIEINTDNDFLNSYK